MRSRREAPPIGVAVALLTAALLVPVALTLLARHRERGFLAEMQADLRDLAVAEESYAYDVGGYTSDLAVLYRRGLEAEDGVELRVHEATRAGWSASARRRGTSRACYVFVGAAAPIAAATTAGSITCD